MKQTFSPTGQNEPLQSYEDYKQDYSSGKQAELNQTLAFIVNSSLKEIDKKELLLEMKHQIEKTLLLYF